MVLLWLLPPVVVTLTAMVWVSWLGREGRGEVDRDVALRRMGAVLDGTGRRRRRTLGYVVPAPIPDRSTGVAVRPSRPVTAPAPQQRRAS